jgi:hypothetical protein
LPLPTAEPKVKLKFALRTLPLPMDHNHLIISKISTINQQKQKNSFLDTRVAQKFALSRSNRSHCTITTAKMTIPCKFSSFLVIATAVVMLLESAGVDAFSLSMSAAGGKTAVIAGATGYIGKWVVKEANRQGYKTVALVRDKNKIESKEGEAMFGKYFEGAQVVECDVCNPEQLTKTMQQISSENGGIDGIVSCLASRSGIKKDAYAIDYQATKNCLDAGIDVGARHFVLLSAFCVKNPWLQFQKGG